MTAHSPALRRVAITGIGVVSCLGLGCDQVARALAEVRSGIRLDPERRSLGFRSALTGVVEPFEPRFATLSRKARKSMPDFVEWATEATLEAVAMTGLAADELKSPQVGLLFGNDSVARPSYQQAEQTARERSTGGLHSGTVFRSMCSTVTMNLNTLLGTQGAAWTLSGACASGSHAVGQAADLIAAGRQRVMICGGAQEISWEAVCSFDALCAFSMREDQPTAASRPFDAGRDGLVPSGGAAALVLEDLEHARGRGATVLGEVLAYAFSSDGSHIAVPSGEGLERSMREALARASVAAADIDYVCAHGTSTPVGDAVEAEAIGRVFAPARPWVSSTKSQTGHEMWMAGAAQVVYTLVAARGGFMPVNANFESPDERTAGLRVVTEMTRSAPELVLLNAAGFGGTNSSLVVRLGP